MYSDPQTRVKALAIAVRRDGDVVDRLRTSEMAELLNAALRAIPIRRRVAQRQVWKVPLWRPTCTVLHDSAVYGYLRDGRQRCNLCDAELAKRGQA